MCDGDVQYEINLHTMMTESWLREADDVRNNTSIYSVERRRKMIRMWQECAYTHALKVKQWEAKLPY